MAPFSGGYGNFLPQDASLIDVGGVFLFHAHRTAAAPDIAGESQQFFHRHQFHIFVTCGLCRFFQIQLAADRNTEDMDTGLGTPGNQRLEDLLRRHMDGMGRVKTVQIIFVKVIKMLPAGDLCLLHQPDCIGFRCHKNHRNYYIASG